MNSKHLPKTDSIEELARFWDTHDLTDFEDELEEVSEQVFVHDTEITVRLHSIAVETLRRIAKTTGIAESELVQNWVEEKIESLQHGNVH